MQHTLDPASASGFYASMIKIFKIIPILIIALLFVAVLNSPVFAQTTKTTGLPLPRFVSLRSDEVNMRTGPGVQYPVEWVYKRQFLPVEIIAEFSTWRKIRDWQGTQGWIHQSMLGGRRTLIVTGAERSLRQSAQTASSPIAKLEPGVVGRLVKCPETMGWCRVEVGGFDGWLRRVDFWGVYRNETIE